MSRVRVMTEFGAEILACRAALAKAGKPSSQEAVGTMVGVSASTISSWEHVQTFPTRESFSKLVAVFPSLDQEKYRRAILLDHASTTGPNNPNPVNGGKAPKGKNNRVVPVKKEEGDKSIGTTPDKFEAMLRKRVFKVRKAARRAYGRTKHRWSDEDAERIGKILDTLYPEPVEVKEPEKVEEPVASNAAPPPPELEVLTKPLMKEFAIVVGYTLECLSRMICDLKEEVSRLKALQPVESVAPPKGDVGPFVATPDVWRCYGAGRWSLKGISYLEDAAYIEKLLEWGDNKQVIEELGVILDSSVLEKLARMVGVVPMRIRRDERTFNVWPDPQMQENSFSWVASQLNVWLAYEAPDFVVVDGKVSIDYSNAFSRALARHGTENAIRIMAEANKLERSNRRGNHA